MSKLILAFLIIPFIGFGQISTGRLYSGKEFAKQQIQLALSGNDRKPFYDTLITDKESAIDFAEAIVFRIYGREDIVSERPYEIYLIDGYWYVSGTLPEGYKGGTFEIIFSAVDGRVIKIMHGK